VQTAGNFIDVNGGTLMLSGTTISGVTMTAGKLINASATSTVSIAATSSLTDIQGNVINLAASSMTIDSSQINRKKLSYI
jgi:hypothetical protein